MTKTTRNDRSSEPSCRLLPSMPEAFDDLRMSVDRFCLLAGLESLNEMMSADAEALCGSRHARSGEPKGHRWGTTRSEIAYHGGKVKVERPRVADGWGWIFTAVEHWNAECVGWHVCKRGDRFAALQPISMGLAGLYGSTAAGAARGLALRMDHGSQYLSDHFTNQIKFWGIQPSYAFVAEPQTNGVAERFNRTLKEQIIHGRIYRNIAELRDAVRDFVELYNAQWIVEKNDYLSPAQARQAWHAAISIRPAA